MDVLQLHACMLSICRMKYQIDNRVGNSKTFTDYVIIDYELNYISVGIGGFKKWYISYQNIWLITYQCIYSYLCMYDCDLCNMLTKWS